MKSYTILVLAGVTFNNLAAAELKVNCSEMKAYGSNKGAYTTEFSISKGQSASIRSISKATTRLNFHVLGPAVSMVVKKTALLETDEPAQANASTSIDQINQNDNSSEQQDSLPPGVYQRPTLPLELVLSSIRDGENEVHRTKIIKLLPGESAKLSSHHGLLGWHQSEMECVVKYLR